MTFSKNQHYPPQISHLWMSFSTPHSYSFLCAEAFISVQALIAHLTISFFFLLVFLLIIYKLYKLTRITSLYTISEMVSWKSIISTSNEICTCALDNVKDYHNFYSSCHDPCLHDLRKKGKDVITSHATFFLTSFTHSFLFFFGIILIFLSWFSANRKERIQVGGGCWSCTFYMVDYSP